MTETPKRETGDKPVSVAAVREFWEAHPVAADGIPCEPGTAEFYQSFEKAREVVEPGWVQEKVYRYGSYAAQRVLDVGCGNGYVLSRYAKGRANVVGVDLTWTGVSLSGQRFRLQNLSGQFLQGNAETLPFHDESFDLVTSMGVLHHVPSMEKAINEIHRVLRPGGEFVIMVYHRNSFYNRVAFPLYRKFHSKFRGMSAEDMVRHVDGKENPLGRVYSRRSLRQQLSAFPDVNMMVASLPPESVPKIGRYIPQKILDWASKRWGWFLYARAVKA
jgi:ubiquinone/menaquinone biosynthesis C-methylase UbiE